MKPYTVNPARVMSSPAKSLRTIGTSLDKKHAVVIVGRHSDVRIILNAVSLVSNATGVSIEDILAKTRKRHAVRCRWLAIWLARKAYDISSTVLGQFFGVHHTTALYAFKNVQNRVQTDQHYAEIAHNLLAKLAPNLNR